MSEPGTSERLTRSTAVGVGWSWLGIAVTTALQVLYTATISRLLVPREFGLIAAALLGLRFVTFVSRFGMGSVVVQRASMSRDDLSVATVISVAMGTVTALGAVMLSPLLAAVVRTPEAGSVIRWLAIDVWLGAVTVVPEGILRRSMRFRGLSICQIASYSVGYLGVGISLARSGHGVWSLVAASICQSFVYLTLVLFLSRPKVTMRFDRRVARQFLSFGGTVSITSFLEFLSSSLDTLAVSRWIGASGLGQYSRATYLAGLPVEQAVSATSRVLMPSFSLVNNDDERFSRGLTITIGVLATVVFVPVLAIAAAAPAVVSVVLGDGWGGTISVLPIVGLAYGCALLTHVPALAAEAKGAVRVKLAVQFTSLMGTLLLISTVVATGPTINRLALAWLGGELIRGLLYAFVVLPILGLSRRTIGSRYLQALVLGLLGAAPLLLVVRVLDQTGLVGLLLGSMLTCPLLLLGGISPACRSIRSDWLELVGKLKSK